MAMLLEPKRSFYRSWMLLNYLQNNKAGTREGSNIFFRFYIIQSPKNHILPEQASHVGICIVYNAQRRLFTGYFAIVHAFCWLIHYALAGDFEFLRDKVCWRRDSTILGSVCSLAFVWPNSIFASQELYCIVELVIQFTINIGNQARVTT
jgi:hypothetical protein